MRGVATIIPIGEPFGRLTVSGPAFSTAKPGKKPLRWYPVECACGTKKNVRSCNLLSGNTLSCGCFYRESRRLISRTHGGTRTRLYYTLMNMVARCYDSNNDRYGDYGGRGIRICDEWRHGFPAFRDWALSSGYSPRLTIERIDVNGDYEPSNCTWIPHPDQVKNRRCTIRYTFEAETKCESDWSQDARCAVAYKTFRSRMQRGWSFEKAFKTPKTKG